jgi:hypothetical protein
MTVSQMKPAETKAAAGPISRAVLFLAIGLSIINLLADREPGDIRTGEGLRSQDAAREQAERIANAFIEKNREALAESAWMDLDALETAVRRLEITFDVKEAAVEDLLDDLFGLTVQAQVIYHMVGGMDEVGRYVQSVIEASWGDSQAQQLEIGTTVEAFAMDLQGNHNQLMLALEADLRALPVVAGAGQNASAAPAENFQKSFGRLLSKKIPALVLNKLTFDIAASTIVLRPCKRAAMAVASRVAAVSAGRAALAGARWSTSVVSFGASLAVGAAADWAITEAAKSELRLDLLEALNSWRKETVAGFRDEAEQALRRGWELRVQDLKEAVAQEALAYLKTHSDG